MPQSRNGRFVKRPYGEIERSILILRIMTEEVCGNIVKRGLRHAEPGPLFLTGSVFRIYLLPIRADSV